MKAIAINGSPRNNGNTYLLLKTVMDELESRGIKTELIQAGGRNIHGCIACGKCRDNGNDRCVFDDDIVNASIESIKNADALILGSPVYFGGLTAQMKAFIDRVGYVTRPHKLLKGKVCASVAVARRNGALVAFNSMNNLFTISECIVIGSSYWNQGVGREIGDVENDAEGVATMKTLGQNMADVLFA
ncbi:MAG: flavodoxin family protein, partial [Eubacteriales bacterium]|nr:flavodoxin family protein [Eubacteriales bacterium]